MPDLGPEPILEPTVYALARKNSNVPYRHELGPAGARAVFEDLQARDNPVTAAAEVEDVMLASGPSGRTAIRIFRPRGASPGLPVVVYAHGPGWVLGSCDTHDRLMRELAVGGGVAIAFVDYARSPEARYPHAAEECYAVLNWLAERPGWRGLDPSRLAVAGDSAGANLAIAATLIGKQRGGPKLRGQLLLNPVTDASFETASYRRFGEGYCLRDDAMRWFWDQYTSDPTERAQITASPLQASSAQLAGLPPALVITAEADVLRDEGEAYAAKLRAAGVDVTAVRYHGVVGDFVTLNALRHTSAARAAIAQAGAFLACVLGTE